MRTDAKSLGRGNDIICLMDWVKSETRSTKSETNDQIQKDNVQNDVILGLASVLNI
jgi:hypothetical protein